MKLKTMRLLSFFPTYHLKLNPLKSAALSVYAPASVPLPQPLLPPPRDVVRPLPRALPRLRGLIPRPRPNTVDRESSSESSPASMVSWGSKGDLSRTGDKEVDTSSSSSLVIVTSSTESVGTWTLSHFL